MSVEKINAGDSASIILTPILSRIYGAESGVFDYMEMPDSERFVVCLTSDIAW